MRFTLFSPGLVALCASLSLVSSACCVTNCEEEGELDTPSEALESTTTPAAAAPTPTLAPADQDLDGDGFTENGGDCAPTNGTIYPGATEILYDGIDQDCSGDDLADSDQDGYIGGGGPDCNDADDTIYPGAPEYAYDGIDQDCNGSDFTDVDGDGYSGGNAGNDCDDSIEYTYPGAPEAPDGVDNDCDGIIDETDDGTGDGTGEPETTATPKPEATPAGPDDEDPIGDDQDSYAYGVIPGCDCSHVEAEAAFSAGSSSPGNGGWMSFLLALLPLTVLRRRRSASGDSRQS